MSCMIVVMYPLSLNKSERLERIMARKEVVTPTPLPPALRSNHPHSSHDDDDDGNDEGTSRTSTPSPTHFVNSLINEVPRVFENPPNIDPNMEPFYTRQTKILNRQVQLRDEHHGGLRSIGKGIKNLRGKRRINMPKFASLIELNLQVLHLNLKLLNLAPWAVLVGHHLFQVCPGHCIRNIMTNSPNVGVPPRWSTSKKSTSGKLDLVFVIP
ncbi:hypothetical protein Tco_0946465 [Tanacetum coccineum]